jgi:hypothetical protein
VSGRIRSIKPEILEDELASGLSDAAWRLWVSLWVLADDHGNVRLGDRYLAANVWQDTTRDPSAPRQELIDQGFMTPYAVRSQRYGHINGWKKHQRIDHPGKERVPLPADNDNTWNQMVAPDSSVSLVTNTESLGLSRPRATRARSPITISTTTNDHEQTPVAAPPAAVAPVPVRTLLASNPEPLPTPSLKPDAVPLLLQPGPPTASTPERDVFEHWVAGWRRIVKGTRPPVLDEKRRGKIRARLADGYAVEDLKRAIDGMWATPWNVEGKHWDIELVCRDSGKVDRFMGLAPALAPPPAAAEPEEPHEPYVPPTPEAIAALALLRLPVPGDIAAEVFAADAERGSDVRLRLPATAPAAARTAGGSS